MNDQPNTKTAPQLVAEYNALVRVALDRGLTGYRELRVFHDRTTAFARIAALEGALRAREEGENAEERRLDTAVRTVESEARVIPQTSPGRTRLLQDPRAEDIRQAVLADQARANAEFAHREDSTVVKKAKKEKKTNGESNGRRGRSSAFADDQKITILAEKNPKREGTKAHEAFSKYRDGMLVSTYLEKVDRGYALSCINWDVKHGFISVK